MSLRAKSLGVLLENTGTTEDTGARECRVGAVLPGLPLWGKWETGGQGGRKLTLRGAGDSLPHL